jgi:hypothetical protein
MERYKSPFSLPRLIPGSIDRISRLLTDIRHGYGVDEGGVLGR